MSVDERLRQVFSDVFGLDGDAAREASAQTVDGWDSIAHVRLVMALEGEFDVQFEAEEIPELVSFATIRARVGRSPDSAG